MSEVLQNSRQKGRLGFHWSRRFIQFAVLAFLIAVPILNFYWREHTFHGNLLSFYFAGLPFNDPLAALQAMAGGVSDATTMFVGSGVVLLIALFLGTIFCGWLCPYGLLSELVHRKSSGHAPRFFPFWSKVVITLAGLLLVFVTAYGPLLNQLSFPGWISRFLQHAVLYHEFLWGLLLVIVMLALEFVFKLRIWCRYLCPQSVLIALASVLLPKALQVRFVPKRCTCKASDRPCMTACSLNLNPRKVNLRQQLECTNCGDCVDACHMRGQALSLGFGAIKKK